MKLLASCVVKAYKALVYLYKLKQWFDILCYNQRKTIIEFCVFQILTLPKQSAKVFSKKIAAENVGGKELIMAMNITSIMNILPVVGFSYYFYFKACFFAGRFCHAIKPHLS